MRMLQKRQQPHKRLSIWRYLLRVVILSIGGIYGDESRPQRILDSTWHIGAIKRIKRR